jgi:hypothetical protein
VLDKQTWSALAGAIEGMSSYVFDEPKVDSDILVADGVRYLSGLIGGGVLHSFGQGDADYPSFIRVLDTNIQWGLPAVDSYYLVASVKGGETYRVHGHRGSARVFDVEVWSGEIGDLARFTPVSRTEDDPEFGPDGQVEFVLSTDERSGNWLRLPDGPATVIVRQYFYDWDTEEPGQLYIERDGAQYPPPPRTTDSIERRILQLQRFLAQVPAVCRQSVDPYYATDPSTIEFGPISFGFSSLQFGRGNYRCEPDQAVIIETPEPACRYWNYQLCNHYWEALDWNVRQTTLNGHQAEIDQDGVFRAVIAHTDPGVPNWLDTAGRVTGLIAARYYRPKDVVTPTVKVVPLAEVRKYLPASTPTVSTAQRQDALRRRFLSVRRTWRE